MSKLIPMEEAAVMLGMSAERLTELRSNNEIFGYRDGSNWKFKMSEIERVADELGVSVNTGEVTDDAGASGLNLTDSEKNMLVDESVSGIGLSGVLEGGEKIENSTLKSEAKKPASDIDLDADDDAISLADSGRLTSKTSRNLMEDIEASVDSLKLADSDEDLISDDSDSALDEEKLSFGESSLTLASESSKSSKKFKDSSDDILDEEPEGGSDKTGKIVDYDDDMLMSEEDLFSDDMSLSESSSFEESADLSSDFEDSSDLVLEDSDSSTEITLEANQSGINLSASESGIALADEPLELGGSDIDALELPEDDDMIVLEDAVGPDEATLMQEDDFNLTPLDSLDDDESTGSQVIALEDSEIYADDGMADPVLGENEEFEAQPAMLDDTMGGDFGAGYGAPGMAPQIMIGGVQAMPEAPYSLWQVLSLGFVAALLTAGGMVAYNLAQNMWMPEDQVIGSSVLNFFLNLTGMNKG